MGFDIEKAEQCFDSFQIVMERKKMEGQREGDGRGRE